MLISEIYQEVYMSFLISSKGGIEYGTSKKDGYRL